MLTKKIGQKLTLGVILTILVVIVVFALFSIESQKRSLIAEVERHAAELSEHIYEQVIERDSNVIEVLINHLRNKLAPELIRTRRGLGYQLVALDDEP